MNANDFLKQLESDLHKDFFEKTDQYLKAEKELNDQFFHHDISALERFKVAKSKLKLSKRKYYSFKESMHVTGRTIN
jgi:hypothetical protein